MDFHFTHSECQFSHSLKTAYIRGYSSDAAGTEPQASRSYLHKEHPTWLAIGMVCELCGHFNPNTKQAVTR